MSAPEKIYLIPESWDGQPGYVWCEVATPTEHHDPADAISYIRADLIAALNDEKEAAPMTYEQWRISYQSSEQAAREAWSGIRYQKKQNDELIEENRTLREKYRKLKKEYNQTIAEIRASAIEEAVEIYSTQTLEGPICYSEALEYHASIIRSEAEI